MLLSNGAGKMVTRYLLNNDPRTFKFAIKLLNFFVLLLGKKGEFISFQRESLFLSGTRRFKDRQKPASNFFFFNFAGCRWVEKKPEKISSPVAFANGMLSILIFLQSWVGF